MRQAFRIPHRSLTRRALGVLLAATLTVTLGAGGCDNKRTKLTEEQSEAGLGLPDTHTDPRKKIDFDRPCELDQLIVDPAEGSPEAVVYALLEVASATGDDAANFATFYGHFGANNKQGWVKSQYWPKAKKYAPMYLQGDAREGISFKICKRIESEDGKVKFFIQSLDEKKSNPPISLQKDEAGTWKVINYTP